MFMHFKHFGDYQYKSMQQNLKRKYVDKKKTLQELNQYTVYYSTVSTSYSR